MAILMYFRDGIMVKNSLWNSLGEVTAISLAKPENWTVVIKTYTRLCWGVGVGVQVVKKGKMIQERQSSKVHSGEEIINAQKQLQI